MLNKLFCSHNYQPSTNEYDTCVLTKKTFYCTKCNKRKVVEYYHSHLDGELVIGTKPKKLYDDLLIFLGFSRSFVEGIKYRAYEKNVGWFYRYWGKLIFCVIFICLIFICLIGGKWIIEFSPAYTPEETELILKLDSISKENGKRYEAYKNIGLKN